MGSILQLLLPLTQGPNGSGRSEVAGRQEDLQAVLHQLKGVAQTLAQASGPQVSDSHTKWASKAGEEMQNKRLTLVFEIKGGQECYTVAFISLFETYITYMRL